MEQDYDIVVLGSGIAGSITALVLQQAGMKTLVIERKTHPRFAIGESTIPTTTLLLTQLAERYGIPELAEISTYQGLKKHGCAAWPKKVFWFGVHRAHAPLEPSHESVNEAALPPVGPDVHMLRADVDAFLVSCFKKYGVDYVENTEVLDFQSDTESATLRIRNAAGEQAIRAQFVVDATGHASFLADRFKLRDEPAQLQTNTRSMFGHFEALADLDEVLGGPNPAFRFRRDGGTMHHCFPGGWIWVIPFDNGVTSVGLELDRRMYPLDESISAEEEFKALIDRYPSIQAHLGAMKPVRPLVRTDRIQFTSKTILGERFILTPHAASFIEPLFSTGIVLTLSFISRFASEASEAFATQDWRFERFRFIEKLFFAEVKQIDLLVNGLIHSFRDYELFKQYWRNWVFGTMAQYMCGVLVKGATRTSPMLYGSGIAWFETDLQQMHDWVCRSDLDPLLLAQQIKDRVDPWWPQLLSSMSQSDDDFAIGSERAVNVMAETVNLKIVHEFFRQIRNAYSAEEPSIKLSHGAEWMEKVRHEYLSYVKAHGLTGPAGKRIIWEVLPQLQARSHAASITH